MHLSQGADAGSPPTPTPIAPTWGWPHFPTWEVGVRQPLRWVLPASSSSVCPQGAACPALSCAQTPCSGSWSSAGPTSPGSDQASVPSTRNCRVSGSGTGERSGQPRLQMQLLLGGCPPLMPVEIIKPLVPQELRACVLIWRPERRRGQGSNWEAQGPVVPMLRLLDASLGDEGTMLR